MRAAHIASPWRRYYGTNMTTNDMAVSYLSYTHSGEWFWTLNLTITGTTTVSSVKITDCPLDTCTQGEVLAYVETTRAGPFLPWPLMTCCVSNGVWHRITGHAVSLACWPIPA